MVARSLRRPPRWLTFILAAPLFPAPCLVAQDVWSPSGLEGKVVTAFGATPADNRLLYAGTGAGEVFRSEDGGQTWIPASVGLPAAAVDALEAQPGNGLALFAGTREGLFRSADGGASWIPSGNGIAAVGVRALAIDAADPATVWASTDQPGVPLHVYKSLDGGETWAAKIIRGPGFGTPSSSFSLIRSIAVHPATSTPYLAWHEIIFSSADGGDLWRHVEVNFDLNAALLDPFDPSVLYVGTIGGGAAASVNLGPWTFGAGLQGTTVVALAADPATPGLLYAALLDGRVFRSVNRGTNWSEILRPPLPATQLIVSRGDGELRAGTPGGVFRLGSSAEVFPRQPIRRAQAPRPPILVGHRD